MGLIPYIVLIIDILYSTGIRVSECASIEKKNISLSKKTIKIMGKGSKNRLVVFGSKTKKNILNYFDKSENCIIIVSGARSREFDSPLNPFSRDISLGTL